MGAFRDYCWDCRDVNPVRALSWGLIHFMMSWAETIRITRYVIGA